MIGTRLEKEEAREAYHLAVLSLTTRIFHSHLQKTKHRKAMGFEQRSNIIRAVPLQSLRKKSLEAEKLT